MTGRLNFIDADQLRSRMFAGFLPHLVWGNFQVPIQSNVSPKSWPFLFNVQAKTSMKLPAVGKDKVAHV